MLQLASHYAYAAVSRRLRSRLRTPCFVMSRNICRQASHLVVLASNKVFLPHCHVHAALLWGDACQAHANAGLDPMLTACAARTHGQTACCHLNAPSHSGAVQAAVRHLLHSRYLERRQQRPTLAADVSTCASHQCSISGLRPSYAMLQDQVHVPDPLAGTCCTVP